MSVTITTGYSNILFIFPPTGDDEQESSIDNLSSTAAAFVGIENAMF